MLYLATNVHHMHMLKNSYEFCRYSTAPRMRLSGKYSKRQCQVLYFLQDFTPRAIIILYHNTTIQCLHSFAWEGMNYYLLYFVYICYYLNEYPKLFKKACFKNAECIQHCICKSHPAGKKWYINRWWRIYINCLV